MAVVFYAGHGLEVDGVNYLVPVDARLERDTDVEYEALALDRVLRATSGAALRVVILDACRNNPLARSMQRTGAARSVSRGASGNWTRRCWGGDAGGVRGCGGDDGGRRRRSEQPLHDGAADVPRAAAGAERAVPAGAAQVLEATDGEQRPHEYGSLLSEHYLGGASRPGTVTVADGLSATVLAQQETVFWQSIVNSTTAADFEAYLRQYPAGAFRALATNRLSALRAGTADAPATRPAADPPPRRQAGEVIRDCPTCPELVVISAGRFRMGCVSGRDCRDDERPVHEVEVPSFALGVYEVTFEEYDRFAAATGRDRPNDRGWGRDGRPVITVSWEDATAYASWLSEETGEAYRLPSESEWEYAARAGSTTRYAWGDDIGRNRANCDGCDPRDCDGCRGFWSGRRTAPAGSFAANAWGLHDMHGNVWEWVEDCWHENYARAPRDGSAWTRGEDCGRRVLRGGSWNVNPRDLRSANRIRLDAEYRSSIVGFRVARTLD